jgi:hypothetical protein
MEQYIKDKCIFAAVFKNAHSKLDHTILILYHTSIKLRGRSLPHNFQLLISNL